MRRIIRSLNELRYLFLVQILEERGWIAGAFTITTLFPLLVVFGLGRVGGRQTPESLAYIITRSTVVSLTTVGVTTLAQMLGEAKDRGVFLFYASLPIAKANLLVAMLGTKLLLQVPGILAALVGGSLIYGFPLSPNPLLLVIIPLSALSLSGIGAAFGLLSPSYQMTNALSQLVLFIVMFAAPVLIPPEALPIPLQWLGWLLPPSYAADAIRRAVAGINDARLGLDLAVLSVCALASFVGMSRGLRWRLG